MNTKLQKYTYQRNWRHRVIHRLKAKLGYYCHQCESPDVAHLPGAAPEFYELVIPNRRATDLAKWGNNSVMIYKAILDGTLPLDRVTLLCRTCKFEYRYKESDGNGLEDANPRTESGNQPQAPGEVQDPAAG